MRNAFRTRIIIAVLVVIFVGICAYVSYQYITAQKEWVYFTSAAQNISENVTVSGVMYHVENGVVTEQGGGQPTSARQLAALRLAYALTLARRSPILDLSGSAPQHLASAATDLTHEELQLIALQTSETNKQLIGALYPISFLNTLAALEQARETFIASGKDTDETSYEQKLTTAITAGSTDIQAFKSAYDQTGHPTYTLIAGVVQGGGIDTELENIASGFSSIASLAQKRSSCIAGDVWNCDANDIKISLPLAVPATSTSQIPAVVQQVVQIYNATAFGIAQGQLVELNSSPCVSGLGASSYFDLLYGRYPARMLFVGDIFFTQVDTGQYDSGLFHNLGVSYLLYNPVTYYTCLENGLEMARVNAVYNTASTLDGSSTPEVVTESTETANLEAALATATPAQMNDLLPVYLMLKDNSAAFPSIVEDIANTEQIDLRQKDAGIATDVDPTFLFNAKSGFYDLFMAYNPSAGSQPIDIYSNAPANPILSSLVKWSQLSGGVTMQKIESDLNAYIAFHLNPESIASDIPSPTATGTPQAPSGMTTYQSSAYDFTLFYPNDLTVTQSAGSDDTMTVILQSTTSAQGFQIYVAPDSDAKITQQRFAADEPSGVMNDPVNITIDGTPATEFSSTNTAMGASEEIWFLHGGFLYEVTAPQSLAKWLLGIMETWQFN